MTERIERAIFWITFATEVFALVLLDQMTKFFAIIKLKHQDSKTVIDGVLGLTYLENKGAAWGVLSGRLSILVILTVLLIPIFVYMTNKLRVNGYLLGDNRKVLRVFIKFDMILMLAGAIGNLIDRIVRGYVIDFFEFKFIDFPVFNVADCYITVGSAIFIIIYLFIIKDEEVNLLMGKGKKSE